jgi:16S rRNA (uracil1498-N3)-methyltransferase
MSVRIHDAQDWHEGQTFSLCERAARHVQVLRLQPGDALILFNGRGGQHQATVVDMRRTEVTVSVGAFEAVEREASRAIHLAVGMPANERMDWLVEKATELGVASIQPLITERSVLRLSGERADKRTEHWRASAISACEQSGRNRVPSIGTPLPFAVWLKSLNQPAAGNALAQAQQHSHKALLSLRSEAQAAAPWALAQTRLPLLCLSGPEGGLSPAEEQAAMDLGFAPVSLGPRTLRSETAPLAALALWTSLPTESSA